MTHGEFKVWLDAYARAWISCDAEAAAELYAAEATYQETPFVQPMRGREEILAYWQHVCRSQQGVKFGYEILASTAEIGIAHWWGSFTRVADKTRVSLDGIFVITLDAGGRCTSLREWWQKKQVGPDKKVELSPNVRRASPLAAHSHEE
jgi:hypothetical protein